MYDPQSTSSGSIMPRYPWLITGSSSKLDKSQTEAKMKVMVTLGVPYTEEDIANAQASMLEQGEQIEKNLYSDPDFVASYEADKKYAAENGEEFIDMKNREIVALIAYLQRLGTDIHVETAQN
jgi:cytochrome c oxidase cbb3-type subunit I/II